MSTREGFIWYGLGVVIGAVAAGFVPWWHIALAGVIYTLWQGWRLYVEARRQDLAVMIVKPLHELTDDELRARHDDLTHAAQYLADIRDEVRMELLRRSENVTPNRTMNP